MCEWDRKVGRGGGDGRLEAGTLGSSCLAVVLPLPPASHQSPLTTPHIPTPTPHPTPHTSPLQVYAELRRESSVTHGMPIAVSCARRQAGSADDGPRAPCALPAGCRAVPRAGPIRCVAL